MARVAFVFADGERMSLDAEADEAILAAARRQGLELAADCEVGDCQTCRAELVEGSVTYDPHGYISLDEAEQKAGAVLCCVGTVASDATIRLPYTRAALLSKRTLSLQVTAIEPVCANAVALRGRTLGPVQLAFHPGQYVNIAVPGTGARRSYSMASAPENPEELEFLIRLLPDGTMSDWLRDRAKVGDIVEITGPDGVFYLREG
ncbi:MAG: FAD-binding oxidoreductase, partial [Roseiarcus sp.]